MEIAVLQHQESKIFPKCAIYGRAHGMEGITWWTQFSGEYFCWAPFYNNGCLRSLSLYSAVAEERDSFSLAKNNTDYYFWFIFKNGKKPFQTQNIHVLIADGYEKFKKVNGELWKNRNWSDQALNNS